MLLLAFVDILHVLSGIIKNFELLIAKPAFMLLLLGVLCRHVILQSPFGELLITLTTGDLNIALLMLLDDVLSEEILGEVSRYVWAVRTPEHQVRQGDEGPGQGLLVLLVQLPLVPAQLLLGVAGPRVAESAHVPGPELGDQVVVILRPLVLVSHVLPQPSLLPEMGSNVRSLVLGFLHRIFLLRFIIFLCLCLVFHFKRIHLFDSMFFQNFK